MQTDYIYLAGYQERVGLFAASIIEQAQKMAWEGLQAIVDDPDPELFFIRPATQQEVDDFYAKFNFSLEGEILEVKTERAKHAEES